MMKKLMFLLVALLCNYFVIRWVPIKPSFRLTDLFLQMLMNPFKYFIMMITFCISFLCYSVLIRIVIEQVYSMFKHLSWVWSEVLLSICTIASLLFLLNVGFWQTLFILCFAIIYGMISIDLRKQAVTNTQL
ncbi:hypothetical protein [Metabacillus iocasae]|uniref:Uncharacterized protein n=1 Tax=Priestia iocasae TaxID=2291674 RepID=A0ABS2QQU5_9BACI|nr:hypothetical protein [Metabacillus iocasae]MBM7701693.1 hypothetical protein [Metabacillus iocasae]